MAILFFSAFEKIVEIDCQLLHVCPSVRLSAWNNRFPLDVFSWDLISDHFSQICREYSGLIKIGEEKLLIFMKTNIHFDHMSHNTS